MKCILILLLITATDAQERRIGTAGGHYIASDIIPVQVGQELWKKYSLRWGDTNFVRSYPESVATRYGVPYKVVGENKTGLVVEVSPNNYERYALVLPLSMTGKVVRYEQPHAYDLNRNLIAYCDGDVDTDSALVVENFVTREKQFFPADSCHFFAFNSPCLGVFKAAFRGDSLYYEWQIQDPDSKKPKSLIKSRVAPLAVSKE
jgi:hypothetical protein